MDGGDVIYNYNIPRVCKECGNGVMIFKGVGEYRCEKCNAVDYDDYGKVRLYIEKHRGATAAEIEHAIGVSQRSIRQMLRDARIEITENSKSFLHCEVCGDKIRSGRFCSKCEMNVHRNMEAEQREKLRKHMQGYSMEDKKSEEGQKRFRRGDRL